MADVEDKDTVQRETPSVTYSQLKNGMKGVAIGEEELFLAVRRVGSKWQFKLYDLFSHQLESRTAWVTLRDPEYLRTSSKIKVLRSIIKTTSNQEYWFLLEDIIEEIQEHESRWDTHDKEKMHSATDDDASPPLDMAEIQAFLDDPALLSHINTTLNSQLYREDENRLFLFLAAVGAKIKTTMIRIQGQNAAGKGVLWFWLPKIFGDENVIVISTSTMSALKRKIMDGLTTKGKIFVLREERGDYKSQIKYAFEQVKSEDRFTFSMSVRDDQGKWQPTDIDLEGPLLFITTTTELQTSLHSATSEWSINPDESLEQTKGIDRWWRARELLPDHVKQTEAAALRRIGQAIGNLQPYDVRIPFTEYITFPLETLADRRYARDFDNLIRFIAFLHQAQRPTHDGKLYALPYDFAMARLLASKILSVTRGDLTDRERELYHTIQERKIQLTWTISGRRPREGEVAEGFKAQDIREHPNYKFYSIKTIYTWLNALYNKGFLGKNVINRSSVVYYKLPGVPAGSCISLTRAFSPEDLANTLESRVLITTPEEKQHIYDAVKHARPPIHPIDYTTPVTWMPDENTAIELENIFNYRKQANTVPQEPTRTIDVVDNDDRTMMEHVEAYAKDLIEVGNLNVNQHFNISHKTFRQIVQSSSHLVYGSTRETIRWIP